MVMELDALEDVRSIQGTAVRQQLVWLQYVQKLAVTESLMDLKLVIMGKQLDARRVAL